MKYLSSKEMALKWNISERTVRFYCLNKRIKGAKLIGKKWFIPSTTKKPIRKNDKYKSNNLLKTLIEEKNNKIKGRIYHKTQIELTYNSNHIEGSKLTLDQTRNIFETKTILVNSPTTINIDDIIETNNHFKCVDFIIDNATKILSEKIIKKIHFLLKNGTSDSQKERFKVGEYKLLENEVGGTVTTLAKNVEKEMKNLLTQYNLKKKKTITDIIEFHVKFEKIHPFQDGNGRVGRLIMFKECLANNIIPFIIDENHKLFYYRGLQEYNSQKGFLIKTCLSCQDNYKNYLKYFKIKTN